MEDGPLPIEVKYQGMVTTGDMGGVIEFMKKYGVSEGVIITKNTEETVETEHGRIRMIPAWKLGIEPHLLKTNA